jgi:hypothetical protein
MLMGNAGNPAGLIANIKDAGAAKLIEEFRAKVARTLPHLAQQAGIPAPPPTPVPPDAEAESKEQIEHLLNAYVQAHEHQLRADIAKFGDVRAEPGFDPEKRLAELDQQRRLEADRAWQAEEVQKMYALMDKLEAQLGKNPKLKPGKVAAPRRELLGCYRKYARRPAPELLPETRAWLQKAERFQERYAHIFRPAACDDEEVLARLAAIGVYDVDIEGKRAMVSWETPAGLTCDWTEFELCLHYPASDADALRGLLNGYDRLRKRFMQHQAQIRHEVLESFSIHHDGRTIFGYERGPDGKPTDAAIFESAGKGVIHLRPVDDHTVIIEVFFHIGWDDEHGLEIGLEDEPDEPPAPQLGTNARVKFHDAGPTLSAEALAAFEEEHEIELPADYRAFLLTQNGGRPTPDRFKVKGDGGALTVYIECLYSVEVKDGPKVAEGLGDAYLIHRANDLPASFLPIGRMRLGDPGAPTQRIELMIALAGKKAGKVVFPLHLDMMMASVDASTMATMFETICVTMAPNFAVFLARLAP